MSRLDYSPNVHLFKTNQAHKTHRLEQLRANPFIQWPYPSSWVLTKEGSTVFSKNIGFDSRRNDVPVVDPDGLPQKDVDYVRIDLEDLLDEIQKTQDIAKALLD
jgi:hypothetical protein